MRTSRWSRSLLALCSTALIGTVGVVAAVATSPLPAGASAAQRVHPGAAVRFAGVRCTAGMLLHQGKTVYVGIPASCGALPLDLGKEQDGCAAALAPVGSPVHVEGARHHGLLVYNSFTTMQRMGTKSPHKCYYNDLALVKLNPADARVASGAVPGKHAPRGVRSRAPSAGSHLMLGRSPATAAGTLHGGWVFQINSQAAMTKSEVGTGLVDGGRLVGMLTVLPGGSLLDKKPAEVYNLHRALIQLRKVHKFRHVALLAAGQRA